MKQLQLLLSLGASLPDVPIDIVFQYVVQELAEVLGGIGDGVRMDIDHVAKQVVNIALELLSAVTLERNIQMILREEMAIQVSRPIESVSAL